MRVVFDAVVYGLLRVVWTIARWIPLTVLRVVLEAAALAVMLVDGRHRRVVRINVSIAFPDWSMERVNRIMRAAFRNWARIAAEVIHASDLLEGRWPAGIDVVVSEIDRLTGNRRGLLVLTAHTGNFELLARLFGRATGKRIWIFYRPMKNRFADGFLCRQRARMNVNLLGRGAGVREALRALDRGEIVAVPLDQNQLPRHGVFVDLFGVPACTSTLLARLSLASGVPVLPVFAVWNGSQIGVEVGRLIEPPQEGQIAGCDRVDVVHDLTQRYTREIERVVRRRPEQWNWAHRRWKTRPDTLPRGLSLRRAPGQKK